MLGYTINYMFQLVENPDLLYQELASDDLDKSVYDGGNLWHLFRDDYYIFDVLTCIYL